MDEYRCPVLPAPLVRAAGRNAYVWGSGPQGCMAAERLAGCGMAIAGFIDGNVTLLRPLPVFSSAEVFAGEASPFFIVASRLSQKRIVAELTANGKVHGEDYVHLTELKSPDEYSFEIADGPESRRFLPVREYALALEKILSEDADIWDIEVQIWNNPLCHPELPNLLEITREKNIFPSLRFSLDKDVSIDGLLESPPAFLQVVTHSGQDRSDFEKKLARLVECKTDRLYYMGVDYVITKRTGADDYRRVVECCADLGVKLMPRHGYCRSLTALTRILDGRECGDPVFAEEAFSQIFSVAEAMEKSILQKERPCGYRNCFAVDAGLTLRQCYLRNEDGLTWGAFLDCPRDRMRSLRESSGLCKRCRERALHRFPSVCASSILAKSAAHELEMNRRGPMERGVRQ